MVSRKKTAVRRVSARRAAARRRLPARTAVRGVIRRPARTAAYAREEKPSFVDEVKESITAALREGRALRRSIERRVDAELKELLAKRSRRVPQEVRAAGPPASAGAEEPSRRGEEVSGRVRLGGGGAAGR